MLFDPVKKNIGLALVELDDEGDPVQVTLVNQTTLTIEFMTSSRGLVKQMVAFVRATADKLQDELDQAS